jgi:hypothetical protein
MSTESLVSSRSTDAPPVDAELHDWINTHSTRPDQVTDLLGRLAEITLPLHPWDTSGLLVQPFTVSLDPQFWPWNLAASNLIERGYSRSGVEIWCGSYLATIKLQRTYHCRYHKGMSLCNIGYALGKTRQHREIQLHSWLLGIIEDVLTNPDTVEEGLNFQNALSMRGNGTSSMLRQLVATVQTRIVDLGVTPSLPELTFDIWTRPTRSSPSRECLSAVGRLLENLDKHPYLPTPADCWEWVRSAWGFADVGQGV